MGYRWAKGVNVFSKAPNFVITMPFTYQFGPVHISDLLHAHVFKKEMRGKCPQIESETVVARMFDKLFSQALRC